MPNFGSVITGTGKYLPKKVLTNKYFEEIVDTTDEWIVRMTGIKERRVVAPEQTSADLASLAALSALEKSGLKAEEIELLIIATISNEQRFPSCACKVQKIIGAKKAFAFDISAGCTGFLYGLDLANAYIKSGSCRNALIIGTEILSRITDYSDRNTCILFGDGAGAITLERRDGQSSIIASKLFSDGEKGKLLFCEKNSAGKEFLRMEGNVVFKHAVRGMTDSSKLVMEEANICTEDLKLIIPHQANERIIRTVAEKLHIPVEKIFMNVAKYGNISSATIPVALAEAVEEDRIKTDDIVLLTAFGAGLTWGSVLIRWF